MDENKMYEIENLFAEEVENLFAEEVENLFAEEVENLFTEEVEKNLFVPKKIKENANHH